MSSIDRHHATRRPAFPAARGFALVAAAMAAVFATAGTAAAVNVDTPMASASADAQGLIAMVCGSAMSDASGVTEPPAVPTNPDASVSACFTVDLHEVALTPHLKDLTLQQDGIPDSEVTPRRVHFDAHVKLHSPFIQMLLCPATGVVGCPP